METQLNKKENVIDLSIPKFIDKKELSIKQITDPDYRLKLLENLYGTKYSISCSKCHHCR